MVDKKIMKKFEATNGKILVNGETILSFVEAVPQLKQIRLATLKKHGINNPIKGEWYSQQIWLNAFKDITSDSALSLKLIGQAIVEHANFPPIASTEEAFKSLDKAYKMNHKNYGLGEIGYYKFIHFDSQKKEIIMEINTPYPEEFDKGILLGLFRRFKPEGAKNQAHCVIERKETLFYTLTW